MFTSATDLITKRNEYDTKLKKYEDTIQTINRSCKIEEQSLSTLQETWNGRIVKLHLSLKEKQSSLSLLEKIEFLFTSAYEYLSSSFSREEERQTTIIKEIAKLKTTALTMKEESGRLKVTIQNINKEVRDRTDGLFTELFGSLSNFDNLPSIPARIHDVERVTPEDLTLTHNIMKGIDDYGRKFFIIRYEKEGKIHYQTFVQISPREEGSWNTGEQSTPLVDFPHGFIKEGFIPENYQANFNHLKTFIQENLGK